MTGVQTYWQANARSIDKLYDDDRRSVRVVNALVRRALRERTRLAVEVVKALDGPTVLDVGCGSGRGSVAYALAGASKVVGVDFSAPMLDLARDFVRTWDVEDKATFLEGEFLGADIDGPFDVVVALGVLDYVAEPVPFLERMGAFATRHVVFSTPSPDPLRAAFRRWRYARQDCPLYFYTENDVRRIVRASGLEEPTLHRLQGGHLTVVDVAHKG